MVQIAQRALLFLMDHAGDHLHRAGLAWNDRGFAENQPLFVAEAMMDSITENTLANLIRTQRIAALGTLRGGAPFVSMILYAASSDFQSFYTLISRLAHHTQDILQDPRVSLMIVEADDSQDPQQLARVSITGKAVAIPPEAAEYASVKLLYLEKFPQTAFNLTLKDFTFYRIQPRNVRYVAGFAKAYNLSAEDLRRVAEIA